MEGFKERKQPFCLSGSFLLAFCVVTFTVAVFEGIGGIVMWTHFSAEQTNLRNEFQAIRDYYKLNSAMTQEPDTQGGKQMQNLTMLMFSMYSKKSYIKNSVMYQ
jgi:hypothetical protein